MSGNPLPDLQPAEFEALKASIRDHGQLEPVVVSAGPACAGEIGDGHHRQRACAELGIECERQPRRFATEVEFRLYQAETNVKRRQLTVGQRIQVARDLIEPLERELAAQRKRATQLAGRKPGGEAIGPGKATGTEAAGDSRDRTAAAVGVSGRTYERGAKVLEEGSDKLRDQFLAGDITVNAAYRNMRAAEKRRERAQADAQREQAETQGAVADWTLTQARCAELEVADGSVDAIITDPPYPREYLDTYGELAELASRALKPGGSLLAMCGQSYLPEVLARLVSAPGIKYQWTIAYLTPGGQAAQLWDRHINTFWKPVVWLVKTRYEGRWASDVIRSATNDNDKDHHHWGQAESGFAGLLDRYTEPGDLVLDPFCGGGTTGAVAIRKRRVFIGSDIDPAAIEGTRSRLQAIAA